MPSSTAAGSTSSLMGSASVNIPSITTMLPKHLLVGRDEELAILSKLYDKSCDCLQYELDELQHELQQHQQQQHNILKGHGDSEKKGHRSHQPEHHNHKRHEQHRAVQKTNSGDTLITSHAPSSSPAKKKKRISGGRVSSLGSGGSVLVHLQGKPGVGKTSLVNQFVREIKNRQNVLPSSSPTSGNDTNIPTIPRTKPGTKSTSRSSSGGSKKLFVSRYKYNQMGNTTPMESIISIMNVLAHQIISCDLYSNEQQRNLYYSKLKEECGDLLVSVMELIPIYSKILPKDKCCSTTSIPDSLQDNVSKTLYPSIAAILKITRLYMAQTPLIIFLDDLQWIDPGSKSCLQYLVANSIPVYMIIAFRDASSQSTFTLESLVPKKSRSGGASSGQRQEQATTTIDTTQKVEVVGIELKEFTYDHVSQFIGYLNIQPQSDHDLLTKFLYDQTEGNQFYLRFRLQVMAETGALMYYPLSSSSEANASPSAATVPNGYWKLDQELINLGMQMSDNDNENVDAIEFCVRVMQTQIPKDVVAVLCRISLMPQGQTIFDLTNLLQYDKKLISLASECADSNNSDQEENGSDNIDGGCNAGIVYELLHRALKIAVQKSILYQHAPLNTGHPPTRTGNSGNTNSKRGRSTNTSSAADSTGSLGGSYEGGIMSSVVAGGLSIANAAFSFAHDRLQQAAAKCITNDQELAEIHFYLGIRRLYCNISNGGGTVDSSSRGNTAGVTANNDESTAATTTVTAASNRDKSNAMYRQVSSIDASSAADGVMDDDYWAFDGGDGPQEEDGVVVNSSFLQQQQKKQRDVEAFEILLHFQNAKSLVLSTTEIITNNGEDSVTKSRDELIFDIGQLAAQASGYYVTAGSHEQFDSMIDFVRELIERVLRNDGAKNQQQLQHDFKALKSQLLIAHHQIKYLRNDLDVAEELFNEVRPRLSRPGEIRDAYFSRISLLVNDQKHSDAISLMGEALAKLKEESVPAELILPEGQPAAIVQEVTKKIKELFTNNPGWDVEKVASSIPISTDEDHNFRVELMISCIASFYLTGRFDLYLYIPCVACLKILENGLTRSSGHSFAVLGFALCAMFGDSFGAEVAMIGKYLVDRFDNPTCVCRALVLSAMAVIYDRRYENLAIQQYYTSYVAGRTAHEILWACYGVYLLSCHLQFDGTALPEVVETLDDMVGYVKSDGHQLLADMGCRAILHTTEMLMHGKSVESPVFHFSIPQGEINKIVPLIPFTHASASIYLLYFDDKLKIAWELIQEVLDNGLDEAGPGIPIIYTFHLFTVLVCHGILAREKAANLTTGAAGKEGTDALPNASLGASNVKDMVYGSSAPLVEDQRKKLKDAMAKSVEFLEGKNKMAPIFTAHASVAKGCALDILDDRPWEALMEFEKAVSFIDKERRGKHQDLIAISNLLSSNVFRRQGLETPSRMFQTKAVDSLKRWGAHYIAGKLSKDLADPTVETEAENVSGINFSNSAMHDPSDNSITSSTTPMGSGIYTNTIRSHSGSGTTSQARQHRGGPDFAAILSTASYIASFNSFDELVGKLSSALLKQATATRLLLLIRQTDSDELEPTAECTHDSLSTAEKLSKVEYSSSIVRITDLLKESMVIHSAQQESPYCFESYIQRTKVQSVASMPIMHQGSVIAVVYMEHASSTGIFAPDIMATMALLGQNVASAIVNARLLRDLRQRTAQLEQSHIFLAKALRVKDTILSNTSHELRSPLHGIIGLNECIAVSDLELHPEVRNCVNSTLAMSRRLLNLVTDILDLSRIGEGTLKLNYETTALEPIVDKVFGEARFEAGNNVGESTILVNRVNPSVQIMVDPTRIKQVLVSLISNAIKFTPDGTVTVTGEFSEDMSMVVISVADTGIGIEQSHLDVVFDPFFQASAYETRNHQGAGLGLSITKQLIELHGGRIDVASKVGEGSTFQVFIPTTPPSNPEGQIQQRGSESPSMAASPQKDSLVPKIANPTESNQSSNKASTPTKLMPSDKTVPPSSSTSIDETRDKKKKLSYEDLKRVNSKNSSHSLFSLLNVRDSKPSASSTTQKFLPLPKKRSLSPSSNKHLGAKREENKEAAAKAQTTRKSPKIEKTKTPAEITGSLESMDSIDQEPLRVFAVDDTAVNLKVLANFLKKANMVVTTATDGKQLLDNIEGAQWTNYDVILLDWMMPVMDGITACKLLRQRIPSDLLPVIFLTAKTDAGAAAKGFEAGGTDFATKPLNRHEVIARTTCQGLASRRARARYFDSIPIAHLILTREPFWKMHSASADREMFVICLHAGSEAGQLHTNLDGSTLLRFFQLQSETCKSDWKFCELSHDSVCFLAMETTTSQIKKYVQTVLAGWAEAQLINSTSSGPSSRETRPVITIGVDYRHVRAHLFGERQPMLAAVESCTSMAKNLAGSAREHEEILLSDAARMVMGSPQKKRNAT